MSCSDSDLDLESKIETGEVPLEVHITLESDDTKKKDTTDSESEENELTRENELTSDNREPSVGLESQQHTHAVVEVHANDSNETGNATVNNTLCRHTY